MAPNLESRRRAMIAHMIRSGRFTAPQIAKLAKYSDGQDLLVMVRPYSQVLNKQAIPETPFLRAPRGTEPPGTG